jgi:hypothetical protein
MQNSLIAGIGYYNSRTVKYDNLKDNQEANINNVLKSSVNEEKL